MTPFVWFNLLLFLNGQWVYVDDFETLEDCQAARQEIEVAKPGNYYCFPHSVLKT